MKQMKQMKRVLRAAGICLLVAVAAVATTPPEGEAGAQPSAQEVAARVERHYNQVETLAADFVQRYTLGRTTLVESGRVYFKKPGRMRWEYNSPEEKLFLTDGKYAYLYVPSEAQVRRTPLKQAPEWQAALALFLGRAKLRRLFARLQLVSVDRADSAVRWQLRGTARSEKQGFHHIWFDLNQRYQLLRLEIQQLDGSLVEFHFRRWEENPALATGLFRLRVPPGTAWIDEGGS